MAERKGDNEMNKDWKQYPLGEAFALLWKPGNTGMTPNVHTAQITWLSENPILTIHLEQGGYLDINPTLRCYVDSTANRFVDGGGDCALVRKDNPNEILLKLSEVVAQENMDRKRKNTEQLKKTLLLARERQMWKNPEEGCGMYPPDAIEGLYGNR